MPVKVGNTGGYGGENIVKAVFTLDPPETGRTVYTRKEGVTGDATTGAVADINDAVTNGVRSFMDSSTVGYSSVTRITRDLDDIVNPVKREVTIELVTEDIISHPKYRNIPPEDKDTIRKAAKTYNTASANAFAVALEEDVEGDAEKDLFWRLRMNQDMYKQPVAVFKDTYIEEDPVISTTEGSSGAPVTPSVVYGLSLLNFSSFTTSMVDHIRGVVSNGVDYWYDRADNLESDEVGEHYLRIAEKFYNPSGYSRFVAL